MYFFQRIQEHIPTALLFWFAFLISIKLSSLYQKKRISYDSNGAIIRLNMRRFKKYFWTTLIIIAPSVLIGFRHYEVGADTINLVTSYSKLSSSADTSIIIWDKILYSVLRYIIFVLSNGNPTAFLFVMVFLTLFILVRALEYWIGKISIPMALLVYYALFGMQLLNQSRQLLALSILFYGMPYLLNNRIKKYLWYVLIASLFHFTALIGIAFAVIHYILKRYTLIKKEFIYVLWILSPLLIYPALILASKILPASYTVYIENLTFRGVGLGLLLTVFPVIIPIFLFRRYLTDNISEYLSVIALLAYPFRFAGYYSYFLMRLNYYSSIYMVLILPLIISKIKAKYRKQIAVFTIIFVFVVYYIVHFMYLDAADIFPYKMITFSNN